MYLTFSLCLCVGGWVGVYRKRQKRIICIEVVLGGKEWEFCSPLAYPVDCKPSLRRD